MKEAKSKEVSALLAALPGMVLLWDEKGFVADVSGSWLRCFDCRAEDVIGLDAEGVNENFILPRAADPTGTRMLLHQARSNPGNHDVGVCHLLPISGGAEHYLRVQVNPVTDLSGIAALEHYEVIDLQVRYERSSEELCEQLAKAQRLELIGTMAAGVFHDLNNVLAIISGYAQMIQMKPDRVEQYIGKITDSCTLLGQIIENASSFAASGGGEFLTQDLAELVDEALHLLRHCISRRISLNWEKPENLPKVRANSTQVFQVVMNLCLNAAQAIPEKGKINVSLDAVTVSPDDPQSSLRHGKYLRLDVSDTGRGMGEWTYDQMFTPFFSKENAPEGRGLGLFVVQQIAECHNAGIEVSSEVNSGTTVSVYFPVLP